jgi:hypothetical protein
MAVARLTRHSDALHQFCLVSTAIMAMEVNTSNPGLVKGRCNCMPFSVPHQPKTFGEPRGRKQFRMFHVERTGPSSAAQPMTSDATQKPRS